MSYYDLDAILTDSQRLPCTFGLDVPGLGYLDGNAGGVVSCPIRLSMNSDHVFKLKAGTQIDLPLWLGVMLAVSSG